ncbi:hypothetical protein M91_09260, partial [Bos mutus]
MAEENMTLVIEFVLTGLTDLPRLQVPLFLVFLVIYLTTMAGNLGLTFLIWKDPHLHTPMYSFLGSLAFVDACSSSSVIPKMLVNILDKSQMMFLFECMAQYYFFGSSATTECFLLVVMAYDRYAAICSPLLYPVVMSNRLCTCLISASYAIGFLHPIIHVGLLSRLTFCRSNIIHHFYCEILPLFAISCTDPSINALVVFIFAAFIQAFTFTDGRGLQEGLQVPLFLVFLVIYLTTMVGNLGLIFLIWKDHLHTPMYSFLGSLVFADGCLSSSVTPKMLMNFLSKDHVSFIECITQFYIFAFSATTENFLL